MVLHLQRNNVGNCIIFNGDRERVRCKWPQRYQASLPSHFHKLETIASYPRTLKKTLGKYNNITVVAYD